MSRVALLFSHHILASKKISTIRSLSGLLNLNTILKVGKPGIIVIEGEDEKVKQMISAIMVIVVYTWKLSF